MNDNNFPAPGSPSTALYDSVVGALRKALADSGLILTRPEPGDRGVDPEMLAHWIIPAVKATQQPVGYIVAQAIGNGSLCDSHCEPLQYETLEGARDTLALMRDIWPADWSLVALTQVENPNG